MSSRSIPTTFQQFDRAKIKFAQAVSEYSQRPNNIDQLSSLNVIAILRPLLADPNVAVKNSSAVALGRISSFSSDMAEAMINNQILPPLVMSLGDQNVIFKKAACFVLKSLAKHSAKLATSVIDSGALEQLAICMEQFDQGIKQSATSVMASIAKHSKQMAERVSKSGCIPHIVLALQQPNPSLKKMAAYALNQIAKHGAQLAQVIVQNGAVLALSQLINHHDNQLKRQVCQCLSSIARHSSELAQVVVSNQIFPKIFYRLKDMDDSVRKNAANLIKQIVKQGPQMAKLFVKKGGIQPTVQFINQTKGSAKFPGILALGFISAFDHQIASAVIAAKSVQSIKKAMIEVPDDLLKASSCWALGMMGGHSSQHAKAMAQNDVLSHLLAIFLFKQSTDEMKSQAKKALKSIIRMYQEIRALSSLIKESPQPILRHIVRQISKNLQRNKEIKKSFVKDEGLKSILQIKAETGSKLRQAIQQIIALYPTDLVQFYMPNYEQALIKKLG